MSQARYYEPNVGPLKLEHDPTPRDYRANPLLSRPAPILLRSDARYKGYPGNSFHSPRIPISQSPDAAAKIANSPRDYFGKITLFEPGRPKLDQGHRGLQYGSQNPHQPPAAPKQTYFPSSVRAVPFGEDKTEWQLNPRTAEIEKRRELQREAERDIQRYKAEQARKKEREMEEKKKDYDRLQHHFMLDGHKHGHGAPRASGDFKRTRFTEEHQASNQATPRYRDPSIQHPDYFLDEMEKRKRDKPAEEFIPGDHALRPKEIIRFQEEGRKSIENRFRYNKPQQEKEELRRDLDKQKEEKDLREKADRIQQLRQELEMLKAQNQTQSGGGAPNRSKSGKRLLVRKNLHLSNDPVEQRKILLKEEQTWKSHESKRPDELKSLELERTQGGAGAPIIGSEGKTVTRHPITMARNDMGESSIKENVPGRRQQVWEPESDAYMGFGRPGAGAPIRDNEGRIVTQVYGKLGTELSSADRRRRTRAARLLKDDLQKEMVEQRKNREDFENHMKAPVGDLTTIMLEGKVGRPLRDPVTGNLKPQHLNQSDVSRLKENKSEVPDRSGTKEYHNFLTGQAEERERTKKLNRLRDDQEWRQHNDAFEGMFGRFGGGNRKGPNLKKESLAKTLYSPRHDAPDWMQPSPREPPVSVRRSQDKPYQSERNEEYSSSDASQRYVKSTFPSTNKNMYEMPAGGPANQYSYRTPYALMGNN